jgi:drug/metabolite transporter (DMT)-like permease
MRIRLVNENTLANIGLFYAAGIWGSTFFIVKASLRFIDPAMLVGYRFALAAAILAVYNLASRRPLFKDLGQGLSLGIFLLLLYITQTIGLKYTTAANSGFITGLFVAFVPIFSIIMFRKPPTKTGILAAIISLAGLWILTGGLKEINLGDILTLVAAMAYAIHILVADKYMKTDSDPYTLCFQQFSFVGIASLIIGLFWGKPPAVADNGVVWIIIFLAIFPTLSAFVIQLLGQRLVTPLRVSLIFAFEPVFAAIFAWTLGAEQFKSNSALGGLLIFLAMLLSGLPSAKIASTKNRTQ